MRQTHTFVTLAVPQEFYDLVKAKLLEANYRHLFHADGTIDMHGLALVVDETDDWHPKLLLDNPAAVFIPEDVMSHYDCTEEQARSFLDRHTTAIEDRMHDAGWEAISDLSGDLDPEALGRSLADAAAAADPRLCPEDDK